MNPVDIDRGFYFAVVTWFNPYPPIKDYPMKYNNGYSN